MRAAPHGGPAFLPLKLGGTGIAPSGAADQPIKCIESEEDQFTVFNAWEAFRRVLCHNPPQSKDPATVARIRARRSLPMPEGSLLGPDGHIERMNAWTHIVGVLIFAIFSFVRPATALDSESTAGVLSAVSSAIIVVTFGVSVLYHTLGTVRSLSPFMRMLDHSAIYVSLAAATTTDLAVVTLDFKEVPWQCSWDSVIVAGFLLAFFSYRRLVLPSEYTEIAWGSCRMGLFRFFHSDYSHSSFRSTGYLLLSLGFVQLLPVAVRNLDPVSAAAIVSCNSVGLALLIAGLILDNVLLWPDVLFEARAFVRGGSRWMQRKKKQTLLLCYNRSCGCVFTAHAWCAACPAPAQPLLLTLPLPGRWHVCTLLSVLTLTVGREVAIARTLELRAGT